jgi:hypothetical protein
MAREEGHQGRLGSGPGDDQVAAARLTRELVAIVDDDHRATLGQRRDRGREVT